MPNMRVTSIAFDRVTCSIVFERKCRKRTYILAQMRMSMHVIAVMTILRMGKGTLGVPSLCSSDVSCCGVIESYPVTA